MTADVRSKKQEVRSLASGSAAGAVSALSAPQARSVSYADLIGKGFKYGGRGPLEYDCYGLAMEIYRRLGIELPEFGSAIQVHVIHRMIDEAAHSKLDTQHSKLFEELSAPEPFCLVTFMIRPPYTSHIGVVLEDNVHFMHIVRKTKVTIERLDNQLWKRRITGFFKLQLSPAGGGQGLDIPR